MCRQKIKAEVTLVLNRDGSASLEFTAEQGHPRKRQFASAALFDSSTVAALRSAFVIMGAEHA
jgi:hypothetical protein